MLPPEVLSVLREWGKQRPTRQLSRLFHKTARAAGIDKPVSVHSLRHSFAKPYEESDTTARYMRVATGRIGAYRRPAETRHPRARKRGKSKSAG
jgi:integrase/recombinase XerD